jgi:hypothetical protein
MVVFCLAIFSFTCLMNSASAAVIFSEDFENYAPGSNIVGQGGWTHFDAISTDPYLVTAGTGMSTNVLNGHVLPSGSSFFSRVIHAFAPLNPDALTTFSYDTYLFSSGPASNNTTMGFLSSTGPSDVNWGNYPVSVGDDDWSFVANGITQNYIGFGFDETVQAQIVVDGVNNEIFGILTHSGGILTTNPVAVSDAYISSLDLIHSVVDYRHSSPTGVEFDNLLLTSVVVPEPSSMLLLGIGALILILFRRRSQLVGALQA